MTNIDVTIQPSSSIDYLIYPVEIEVVKANSSTIDVVDVTV